MRKPRPTAWVSRRLSDLPTPPEVVQARELRERARRQGLVIEYHLLLLLTLGLVAFGLIMVYSASSGIAVVAGANPIAAARPAGHLRRARTVGCMAVAARCPYRRWRLLIPLLHADLDPGCWWL